MIITYLLLITVFFYKLILPRFVIDDILHPQNSINRNKLLGQPPDPNGANFVAYL